MAKLAEQQPEHARGQLGGTPPRRRLPASRPQQRVRQSGHRQSAACRRRGVYEPSARRAPRLCSGSGPTFGLARALETKAISPPPRTTRSSKQWPDGAYADYAAKRLDGLAEDRPPRNSTMSSPASTPKPDSASDTGLPARSSLPDDSLSEPEAVPTPSSPFDVQSRRPEGEGRQAGRHRRRRQTSPSPSRRRRQAPIDFDAAKLASRVRTSEPPAVAVRSRQPSPADKKKYVA